MKKLVFILIMVALFSTTAFSERYKLSIGRYQVIQERSLLKNIPSLNVTYLGKVGYSFCFDSGFGNVVYYPIGKYKMKYYAWRDGAYYLFTITPITWTQNSLTADITKGDK